MGAGGPMFDIRWVGLVTLPLLVLLVVAGIVCAVRGQWRRERRARRLTLWFALATFCVGVLSGAHTMLRAWKDLAQLGPAVTTADVTRAYREAAAPVLASFVGMSLVAGVAGLGWALAEDVADPEAPPRRPA